METIALAVAGMERRYLLYTPRVGGLNRSIVIFLHGTGGTAAWAEAETGWPALAEREQCVLAMPEGLPPDPSKPAKFLTNPPRWNDGSTQPGDFLHSDADDVGYMSTVVADVLHRCGGDPLRVYLSGFSNGAGMAFRFAAERAELLAALAPVSGHCWIQKPKPARPIPTLYLIGTSDPLVPLHGGSVRSPWGGTLTARPPVAETLARWARAIGCDRMPWTASEDAVRVEVFLGPVEFRAMFIEGLGHHWPGGQGQLGEKIGGDASTDLNANEVIWEFFQRHVL